ncbi:MAG: hypothetical protein IJ811_04630 [Clostridia bacterium]|nr:hypothetical protein [Clostridia bacterium]
MKRAIVLQVRTSEDRETHETLAWVSVGCIPARMQDGRLYYPKTSDTLITTCAGETRSPDKFKKFKSLKVGSVVDLQMALNEFTNKSFVNDIIVRVDSKYVDEELYGKNNEK